MMGSHRGIKWAAAATALCWCATSMGLAAPAVAAGTLPNGDPCADVVFIGARGSGQSGYGPEVRTIRDAFVGQFPDGGKPRELALPYPAESTALITSQTVGQFLGSVNTGVILLKSAITQSVEICGGRERIVLAGYSQGSWVVHETLRALAADPATAPYLASVSQTVLVADPLRVGTSSTNRLSTAPTSRNGVVTSVRDAPASQYDVPAAVRGDTYSICYAYDPVCDFGVLSEPAVHSSYKTGPELPLIGKIVGALVQQDVTRTQLSTSLVIDSSGSMTSNDPQNQRLSAARAFVTAALPGDEVAVVDFDDVARTAIGATSVDLHRQEILAAIDTIDSNGGTDLGVGLTSGCEALQQATGIRRGAIFLTDGDGAYNGEAACFSAHGWPVLSIGLGPAVNEAVLSEIAGATGGRYVPLPSAASLACEFQQMRAELAGQPRTSDCKPTGTIAQGQVISFVQQVAAKLRQFTFTNLWPGSDIEMTVTSPSGRTISRGTNDPDVVTSVGATYESFTVSNPEPGPWQVKLVGTDIPAETEPYTFSTLAIPEIQIDIDTDGDGVTDLSDNCAFVANAGQADGNADGVGDACEAAQPKGPAAAPTPTPAPVVPGPTTTPVPNPSRSPVTKRPNAKRPIKVKGVKLRLKRHKLTATWRRVPGATAYRYRIGKLVRTTAKTRLTVAVGHRKKVTFTVRALNAAGAGAATSLTVKQPKPKHRARHSGR